MRYSLAWIVLAASCIPLQVPENPSRTPTCSARHERPWTAPEFIAAGNQARDQALADENARLLSPPVGANAFFREWTSDLREASDCYEKALRVNPGSYEARLGLGTVYLVAGLRAKRGTTTNPFFTNAKQHLGRAYFLRNDRHEPLVYLSLISTVEGQLPVARQLLGHLQKADPRNGEVLTLLGYYSEETGDIAAAKRYYVAAYHMGASADTLTFLNTWIRKHP